MINMETSSDYSEPLRVAIVSDSAAQQASLRDILVSCGLNVVLKETMTHETISGITRDEADVLLVDLDDNIDHDLDFLDGIMESQLPVLFNDSAATRLGAAHKGGEWGRNLARKLNEIVGHETEPVTAPVRLPQADEQQTKITAETVIEEDTIDDLVGPATPLEEDEPSQPEALGPSIDSLQFPSIAERVTQAEGAARTVWVIGASIGGPQAVKDFLSHLDGDLSIAFVMAQHIGASFVSLLSKQLNRVSKFEVMPAEEGHVLKHGEVVITPVNQRVVVSPEGVIELKPMITPSVYTPSIDEVMTDIAIRYGIRSGAIIFSGMGSDGVRGCQVMAARGAQVWAQEASTCVISSMPDSTRRAGIVSVSGTPFELANRINETFKAA